MAGDKWEVVGGGKAKKPKPKPVKAAGKEKNTVPAFDVSAPIKESQTIYTAFLEKEKKEAAKPKLNGNNESKPVDKLPQKKKKTGGDKKASPSQKATLEQVFDKVTDEDLKDHVATLEVLCPNSPLLWLKDVTSYLNVKLDVPVEDLVFASKPLGYPSNLLKKSVQDRILGLLKRCTPQVMQVFYEFCLQNVVQDILKGLHTLGYRVMLQLIARVMPSVALSNLSKCSELCQSHQNRQSICLTVLWAAGQAGNNDLEAGLKVWLELMFPLISAKNCTAYVVEYLEKLTSMKEVEKCSKSLVSPKDLFPILDFIYSKELAKNVQKRMIALYPTLKTLSYGPELDTSLRNFFPSYLRRLEPQCTEPFKEEILSSLMLCLEKDNRCYSIWRQLYTKHFVQSKLLISHLNDHWASLQTKFPRRCLRDTLSTFHVTNEELLSSGRRNMQDVEECMMVNKELLSKMNTGSFPWKLFVFGALLVSFLLLQYDISTHGSFADSLTGKFLKDYGLLVYYKQAGEKVTYFYGKAQKLCGQYVPPAVQWLSSNFQPFLELCFLKISLGVSIAWDATSQMRSWCSLTLPPLLASSEKLFVSYGTVLQKELSNVIVVASKQFLAVSAYVVQSADSLATWIQDSPAIMAALEGMKQSTRVLAENVQRNALYLFQLARDYIPLPT